MVLGHWGFRRHMTYETYGNSGTPPAGNTDTSGEAAASVVRAIRRFLEHHELRSYCDACLARRFDVTVDEARAIARTLSNGTGFVRQNRSCAACTGIAVTTSVGIRLRPA